MAKPGAVPPAAVKKPAAPRQRKVLAALSPTAAAPEVMMPAVALDEAAAAPLPPVKPVEPMQPMQPVERKKDQPRRKKQKLVRKRFSMPEEEYAALGQIKKACIDAGVAVKKRDLLRVALSLLQKTDMPQLRQALDGLAPVKRGRPDRK